MQSKCNTTEPPARQPFQNYIDSRMCLYLFCSDKYNVQTTAHLLYLQKIPKGINTYKRQLKMTKIYNLKVAILETNLKDRVKFA